MPDVFFALTGDPRTNSRALRQLRVLAEAGLAVEAVGFGGGDGPEGFPAALSLLTQPTGAGPGYFWRVHRRLSGRIPAARVYHASDLYVLPALARAARRHGGRLVFDARELYPHVASTRGRPWVSAFWRRLQHRYIRRADHVFTVSGRIADHLADAHGIPRPTLLPNVPPPEAVPRTETLRRHAGLGPEAVIVLHQGQMRADRGCHVLVEAVARVPEAHLVFLGGGPEQPALAARAEALGLADRVRFVPSVPPDALLAVTAGADVGVTLLEDTCLNHRYALPNKLFEYLAAGVPVLGSDLPEVRDVVTGHDVGLVADAADPAAVAEALGRMVRDAAARARWAANAPAVFRTYDPVVALGRFADIYRGLLQSGRSNSL